MKARKLLQCFVPQNHIGYITTKAAEDVKEEVQDAKQVCIWWTI